MDQTGRSGGLRPPAPILVADLFQPERAALLALLRGLSPAEWDRPTACSGWSVKDVALHILGGDIGNVSRRCDGVASPLPPNLDLVTGINLHNQRWVEAARMMSPGVICDLLAALGEQTHAYFNSLDPLAEGGPVSWAGPRPAPVWLDVAREYTERWHHQQHIRDAVRRPGLTERRFLHPVLATFVHALPHSFRDVPAPDGTVVQVRFSGDAGGEWALRRTEERWLLLAGTELSPSAGITIDQDAAWRLLTRGLGPADARRLVRLEGDVRLAETVLDAVAIIA